MILFLDEICKGVGDMGRSPQLDFPDGVSYITIVSEDGKESLESCGSLQGPGVTMTGSYRGSGL